MSSDEPPLVLYYSALKGRFVQWDANGHATFAKYEGKPIVIDATVTDVQLVKKSPSIAIENDVAYFSFDSVQSIPGHSEFHTIELKFDQYGLYDPKPFVKGEKWRFTLAENGVLVSVEPLLGK